MHWQQCGIPAPERTFEKPTDPFMKSVIKAAETAIHTYVSNEVEVVIATESKQAARPEPGKLLPQVKNIIGISSGKGGVGKSTVSANLAVALAKLGYKVGLLDADIFGPSMPKMFQVEDARPYAENVEGRDLIVPVEKYGIKLLSIGFFVDPDQATLWRGGMASNALKQLIGDANWGDLDYFLIDLPPGTSDIHLTVVQTLALTGAIVVSTPQAVALADARKGINMFVNEKVNVPILGLVENMAWFTPAELPENKYYIFGKEGAKKLAEEMNVPLLGSGEDAEIRSIPYIYKRNSRLSMDSSIYCFFIGTCFYNNSVMASIISLSVLSLPYPLITFLIMWCSSSMKKKGAAFPV